MKNSFDYRISVFTPTYNRGYIIEQLYSSLQRQTFKNFEWIVVDDGSTDKTFELFESFKKDNNAFSIEYVKTENGGKHRAINKGLSLAKGELFYIVDSDDYLPNNALEIIDKVEKSIPVQDKASFAGVCGIKSFNGKKNIGSSFDGEYLDITMLERIKYNITGDKAEAFYTSVLSKYPFPEYQNENFITECVVWDKIASDGYKLRFFNESTMICEYLEDGLSAKEDKLFEQNPKGHGLYLYQSAKYRKDIGLVKWNKFLQYYYKHRNNLSFLEISENLHMNPLVLFLRLFGMKLFYRLYDR